MHRDGLNSKWLLGVGGAILGVMVTVQLYLHTANRTDMSAMEHRLSDSIMQVANTLRGQDERIRKVEVQAAVNDALARMAVDISTNRSGNIAAAVPSDDDAPPPAG